MVWSLTWKQDLVALGANKNCFDLQCYYNDPRSIMCEVRDEAHTNLLLI